MVGWLFLTDDNEEIDYFRYDMIMNCLYFVNCKKWGNCLIFTNVLIVDDLCYCINQINSKY